LTIIPSNILLEQLILEEESAQFWDNKLFKINYTIKTTSEIADATMLQYPLPSIFLLKRKKVLQTSLSVLMASIFTFIFGYILLTKYSSGALLVSTIMLSLIYLVLYKNLTMKFINFEIKLSKKGIEIDNKFYQWAEIQETFIVYRPKGKIREIYFVIGLKNGFLDRLHMNNLLEFNLNERKFSALIEEYKK
jgi:hypothetical protein